MAGGVLRPCLGAGQVDLEFGSRKRGEEASFLTRASFGGEH